jgi:hypothetical protein
MITPTILQRVLSRYSPAQRLQLSQQLSPAQKAEAVKQHENDLCLQQRTMVGMQAANGLLITRHPEMMGC